MSRIREDLYRGVMYCNVIITVGLYLIYVVLLHGADSLFWGMEEAVIFVFSWIGIAQYIYILFTTYLKDGTLIQPYIIFISFFVLFNYGQPLLWALGIHATSDIGEAFSYNLWVFSDIEIIKTQMITLIIIGLTHCGAFYSRRGKITCENFIQIQQDRSILYSASKILAIFVIPGTFYDVVYSMMISQIYGYGQSMWVDYGQNSLITSLLCRLFYPVLFGLLIGSNYKKSTKNFVYITYVIYALCYTIKGGRGGWLYALPLFLYFSHIYVKKLNFKKLFSIAIAGLVLVVVLEAVVSIRKYGVTIDGVLDALHEYEENPFFESIREMGGSMTVQATVVRFGYDIYPYGNTYLMGLLGALSDKAIYLLGFSYVSPNTWFSKEFLGISWGAGFSYVAELLINFGPYIAPIAAVPAGAIIYKVLYINNEMVKNQPYRVLFSVIAYDSLVMLARGTFPYYFKIFVFSIIAFSGTLWILSSRRKHLMR